MAKHAFLSASSAHRWLECPPSAKACEGVDDRASPYAKQGTDCHELCAYLVEKALGREAEEPDRKPWATMTRKCRTAPKGTVPM